MQERIRQKKFFRNNGVVLKGINLLREKYVQLSELKYALEPTLTEQELRDSINYLSESGFINMRNIRSKQPTSLADCDFYEIEAKVSAEGIKIIACVKSDECIEV
ncbi:type VI secretion protein [Ruminococcus flavefaciens]|uniref:type VI secretion protein n=1 Tax=Ruminococcus flavefaciens TaxID=1265 RepID=UPI0015669FFE|nr:type VI secretion protein [Ruminococcus flavefaciens]